MTNIKTGGCLCNEVSYEINPADVVSTHHCHCKDCQKSTGSGKSTIIIIPAEQLVIKGNLKFFTVTGSAGSHISRGFCPSCGSPVVSYVEENPAIKFLKAGSLDDKSWLEPVGHIWTKSAQKWVKLDGLIYKTQPDDNYAALIAAFDVEFSP